MLNKFKSFHYSKNYPQHVFYEAVLTEFKRLKIASNKQLKVADLPCGHGEFSYNLASNNNLFIDASDISPSYIAHAKTYFQRENIRYSVADILDALDGKEKTYDAICNINSLFLLPEHKAFLTQCYKALRVGGKLFLVIPNSTSANFKSFQKLDPTLNVLILSKHETIDYISSFGFNYLLDTDIVYASFYNRRELKFFGPFSNVYLILLNKLYTAFKAGTPAYHLLVFEK